MKKMKSLALAFAAVAGIGVLGSTTASAQTVPVNGGTVYSQQAYSAPVSQGAIDDLAYNVGVQTAYYRDGRGFTQGWAQDGEYIGLEYRLNGNNATVARAYNLNDRNSANQFQAAIDTAAANDRYLSDQEYRAQTRVYTVYEPSGYIICAPVAPIIGIGWVIGGWYPGYMPVYHHWNGFWDNDGHRRGWDRDEYREHGGWRNSGQWGDREGRREGGQWGRDGRREVGQPAHDGRRDGGLWQQQRQPGGEIHRGQALPPPVHRMVESPRAVTPLRQGFPQQIAPQRDFRPAGGFVGGPPQHVAQQGGAVDRGGFRGGAERGGVQPAPVRGGPGPAQGGHHR